MPPSIAPRLLVTLLLASACDHIPGLADPAPPTEPTSLAAATLPSTSTANAPIPADPRAILLELAPLPDQAVVIVYDVIGPAGMSGTLEVLAAEGGLRRDNWAITLPLPTGTREIRGSAVQTPTTSWRAEGETAGIVEPARLHDVADAIAKLDPDERTKVITEIRKWQAELALARAEDPGERDTVAGISCVRVRAGGGEVCTWEEAGLPLRYDGATFSIVASHVERGASLGVHAFDIPADAAKSPLAAAAARPIAPELRAIAAGDRSALLRLLVVDSFPALSAAQG
jgi:hypothetical protein